ncbi:hypothetical protein [Fodinibius halophilus]|uniref:Uncharacterized protein n=1 Tax=Fodinibius halophilus TaxID=1736908 RepID=A0A6M1TDS4_9BACT|nr:hypothetical protein [Fodinibius halophilus]NGP88332.1 hypothetical protein [Fodinibius halophilus]
MSTKEEIKQRGMKALLKELGDVDTEVFIKMLIREPFDYTKWQRDLWADMDVDEISEQATEYQKKKG